MGAWGDDVRDLASMQRTGQAMFRTRTGISKSGLGDAPLGRWVSRRAQPILRAVGVLLRLHLHRSRYKFVKAIAAAILQMLVLGAVGASAEQPSLTLLTSKELFEGLNEYAFLPFGSKTERFLIKWKDGIRFGASKDGDITPEIVDFISEELGVVSRLTRLKIESKNDDANLVVVFTDNPQRDFPKYKSELKKLFLDDVGMAALYKEFTDGEFLCAGKILVTDKKEIANYFFSFPRKGKTKAKSRHVFFGSLCEPLG